MGLYYKLDGKEAVECSIEEFSKAFDDGTYILKKQALEDHLVSTVFLGINTSACGKPILFETMVFSRKKEPKNEYTERYHTYDQAIKGHERIVKEIQDNGINKLGEL